MLTDGSLLENPGILMVITQGYALRGDFALAVTVGTKLQSLDPTILRSAVPLYESSLVSNETQE